MFVGSFHEQMCKNHEGSVSASLPHQQAFSHHVFNLLTPSVRCSAHSFQWGVDLSDHYSSQTAHCCYFSGDSLSKQFNQLAVLELFKHATPAFILMLS